MVPTRSRDHGSVVSCIGRPRPSPNPPPAMRPPLALICLLASCATPVSSSHRPAGHASSEGPTWIAHRGNSSVAPENTLAAVRSALDLPRAPHFVEIDVYFTADRELAVIHDSTLDRTTDKTGAVAELSWAEVRRADAGFADRFGDSFRGERVPALAEVLDAVAGTHTGIMIEVKAHGVGGPAARLVAERGELDRHVLASFHADVVVDASLAAPGLRTLLLVGDPGLEHVELARRVGASILGASHEAITRELVEAAHSADLELWAWTVDDPERAAELLALGVDGVISNTVEAISAGH